MVALLYSTADFSDYLSSPQNTKKPDQVCVYMAADFGTQPQTPIMSDGLLLFAVLRGGDYSKVCTVTVVVS
jgi:hypothetical protein